jgi:hypothetical protein
MTPHNLIPALVDAKRKLDVAARVLYVLDHSLSSTVGDAERAECVRVVDETREMFDEHVDALSAEDRWQFVYALMIADALQYEE